MVLPVQHSHGCVSGCERETAVRLGFDSKLRPRATAHKWNGLNISEAFSGLEIKRLRVPDKGPVSGNGTSQDLTLAVTSEWAIILESLALRRVFVKQCRICGHLVISPSGYNEKLKRADPLSKATGIEDEG
jgi:hypothetical protein